MDVFVNENLITFDNQHIVKNINNIDKISSPKNKGGRPSKTTKFIEERKPKRL